jgi:hypothetical protein
MLDEGLISEADYEAKKAGTVEDVKILTFGRSNASDLFALASHCGFALSIFILWICRLAFDVQP